MESEGLEAADGSGRFLARVMIGTRNKRDVLAEFEAPSLSLAEQEAEDWLHEYCARVGLGGAQLLVPAVMRARSARLHDGMPILPAPSDAYCKALKRTAFDEEQPATPDLPSPYSKRRRIAFASRRRIASTVASARSVGVDVAGIRVWPDGSVAVFDARFDIGQPDVERGREP